MATAIGAPILGARLVEPNIRGTPMPEQDAGCFNGVGSTIQFSHTHSLGKNASYTISSNGNEMFKGGPTNMTQCGLIACCEFMDWCQPITRQYELNNVAGGKAFGLTINKGFCDFTSHVVTDANHVAIGFIKQPALLQRLTDAWRSTMNIVLRLIDVSGHERWTLRRLGACGPAMCPGLTAGCAPTPLEPGVGPCDCCDGRECWIPCDEWFSCDFSHINCATCNGQCNFLGGNPCCKCQSCNDCCKTRPECQALCQNPGTECEWRKYIPVQCNDCKMFMSCPCDSCNHNMPCDCTHKKCMCFPCRPCDVGNGCCWCCCKDCECCKTQCDYCMWCITCQCRKPGCKLPKFKCRWCKLNFKCCKCEGCGANCKAGCALQCAEIKRCITDCPDCKAACSGCCSKCKPTCAAECGRCKAAITGCVPWCKSMFTFCPRRCCMFYCGGKTIHMEIDVYGPDGTPDVPVGKICYDGFTGWMDVFATQLVTMRPGYVCTISIPTHSPYYSHYHNRARNCDYVDLALLTSFAIWYDFYCVAPLEFFQCVNAPANMTEIERSPPVDWFQFPLRPRAAPWKEMMAQMGMEPILALLAGIGSNGGLPPFCNKGHTMKYYTTDPANYGGSGYSCNYCSSHGEFAAGFHHCDTCGTFDCCPNCFNSGKANTKPASS